MCAERTDISILCVPYDKLVLLLDILTLSGVCISAQYDTQSADGKSEFPLKKISYIISTIADMYIYFVVEFKWYLNSFQLFLFLLFLVH